MRRRRRTRRPNQRGFALFVIVLIVALVAVTGGTLLDLVEVDLIVTGVNRQTKVADATATGGVLETIADETLTVPNIPIDPSIIAFQYASDAGGTPTRDPNAIAGPSTAMNETNSAFTRFTAQPAIQESYSSDVRLIRLGPALDTSVDQATAVFYEVRSISNIAGGSATKEVRAEVYRVAGGSNVGRILSTAADIHNR